MDTKLLDQLAAELAQSPEFKKTTEKLQQLGERRSKFQKRKDELLALLLLPDNAKSRGQRLLEDNLEQDMAPSKSAMREELLTCDTEIEAADEALRRIQEIRRDLRREDSYRICQELRPEYVKIAARMLDALRQLAAVNQQEIEFIDQLERHDITLYLQRCVFSQLGTLADSQSMVSFRIQQIEQDYPELKARKVA